MDLSAQTSGAQCSVLLIDAIPAKKCNSCKQTQPLDRYYPAKKARDGRDYTCKACVLANRKLTVNPETLARQAREWRRVNPKRSYENARRCLLKRKYGLTFEDIERGKLEQDGKCAICRNVPAKWHIDHDHVSGKYRGLLCQSCNLMLGHAKDNASILARAIEYLEARASGRKTTLRRA